MTFWPQLGEPRASGGGLAGVDLLINSAICPLVAAVPEGDAADDRDSSAAPCHGRRRRWAPSIVERLFWLADDRAAPVVVWTVQT